MRFEHDIKPVPAAGDALLDMVRALPKTRRPVILIDRGKPQAVLVDVPSYSVLREIALLVETYVEGRERAERPRPARRVRRRS